MKDQPNASPDNHEFEQQFDILLRYLKRARGIDLGGYKRPSLMRRITRRMEAVKRQLTEAWDAGSHSYVLNIEPEVFWRLGGPPKVPDARLSRAGEQHE